MTSITTLPAHATWCAAHEPDDPANGVRGFCQSRVAVAGDIGVRLIGDSDGIYVELVQERNGASMEVLLNDLPALHDALGEALARSQA